MPIITIGMPVYNGERFLEEALRSILAQTYDDLELIISDNASTDRTVEIAKDIAAGDRRVMVKQNAQNLGAAPNYNVLVGLARGRYFKWAAHDDNLAPTYVERCVGELDMHDEAVLCYPTTVMIDEEGRATGQDPFDVGGLYSDAAHERFRRYMELAWPICGCNAVFGVIRLDALKRTRLIGGYASSDKILLGELALLGKFHQLSDQLFLRREHPRSSVRANPGIEARNLWFDTSAVKKTEFIRWRWVGECMRGIVHVPISPGEKIHSLWQLRHHLSKDKDRLKAEVKKPVKDLLAGIGLREGPRS